MIPLHRDMHFAFHFAEDRIIHRFHLEGIGAGRRVNLFWLDGSGVRLGLLTTATVGDGGWVDLPEPILVGAGRGFVAVPLSPDSAISEN